MPLSVVVPEILRHVVPLVPALLEGTQFPRRDASLKWLNLAHGIVLAGIDVDERLSALNDSVKAWAELGVDPPQEWWDEFTARSEAAHETIQEEAKKRRTRRSTKK